MVNVNGSSDEESVADDSSGFFRLLPNYLSVYLPVYDTCLSHYHNRCLFALLGWASM
jgi:hypothetical protein